MLTLIILLCEKCNVLMYSMNGNYTISSLSGLTDYIMYILYGCVYAFKKKVGFLSMSHDVY